MPRIALFITFKAKPGARDALAAHLAAAGRSYSTEAGTEAFVVAHSLTDPDAVLVYERYADEAAKAAHEAAPGYAGIREKTGTFLAGAPAVVPMAVVGGKL